jgi:hypothetical protein
LSMINSRSANQFGASGFLGTGHDWTRMNTIFAP